MKTATVPARKEKPAQGPDWVGFWKLILVGQQRRLAAEANVGKTNSKVASSCYVKGAIIID